MTTRRWTLAVTPALVAAAIAGCEVGPRTVGYEPLDAIEPGIERELALAGACGDLGVFAIDGAESVVLFAAFPGAVRAADRRATVVRHTRPATDDATGLRLMRGEGLLTDWCNREPPVEPIAFESWRPAHDDEQRGGIELLVDPGKPGDGEAVVRMTLTDVTFVDEDGGTLSIASLVIGPTAVGD